MTEHIRNMYTSAMKQSPMLNVYQCTRVATALNLSQSAKEELRQWKRRGTREAQPVSPRRPIQRLFFTPYAVQSPLQHEVPQDTAAEGEYTRKTHRERERAARIRESVTESATGQYRGPSPVPERPKSLPPLTPAERHVVLRRMELRYKIILRMGDEEAEPDLAASVPAWFSSAESYAQLWTQILVKEAKAGLSLDVAAEEEYYRKLPEDAKQFVRAPFQVVSISDKREGLLQVELKFAGQGLINDFSSRYDLDSNFESKNLKLKDVLRLEILATKSGSSKYAEKDSAIVFGVVTEVNTSKYCAFTLQLPKQDAFPSSAWGVRVNVSRVASLVPKLRQLDALWSINCLSERMLRILLRPNEGWTMAKEDKKPNQVMDVAIRSLHDRGVLNLSQAEAVSAVVRKVGKIDPRYFTNRRKYTRPSRRSSAVSDGSLTLIQGPPGTGKTTTILTLLSIVLSNRDGEIHNRMRMEKKADIGIIATAPFRILVCAPSNAAVDEIMNRVMQKGLLMPNGDYASPHVVRIGKRSSMEEDCSVEVKTLAKMDPEWTSAKTGEEAESSEKAKELKARLREVRSHLDVAYIEQSEIRRRLSDSNNAAENDDLRAKLQLVTDNINSSRDTRDELRRNFDTARSDHDRHFNERNVNNTRAIAKV